MAAVRRVVGFLGKRPGWTALSIGLLLLNISIELSLPQFLGSTITALGGTVADGSLARTIGLFLGLVVLRAGIGLVLGPIRNRTAQTALGDIRAAVYEIRRKHETSLMAKGIFKGAARESESVANKA